MIALIASTACSTSKPAAAPSNTTSQSVAATDTNPTADDYATDMANAVTASLKSHGSPEQASFGQVQPVDNYGDVLILHMNANGETTSNAAGFALLAFAEAAGTNSGEVADFPSIVWASLDFGGGASGRLYVKFEDALEYDAGTITAAQLRQRTVFP